MATFGSDNFTDTDGTLLQSHTPSGGGTWTKHASVTGNFDTQITSNRAQSVGTVNGISVYYHSGTPGSADYAVAADAVVITDNNASGVGPAARIDTSAHTFYWGRVNSSGDVYQLFKTVAGTSTQLGSNAATGTLSGGRVIPTEIDVSGTTITFKADGSTQVTTTDSAISAAGKAGIRSFNTTTSTAGLHLDNFSASDLSTTITVPNATGAATGQAPTVILSVPNATASAAGQAPKAILSVPNAQASGAGQAATASATASVPNGTASGSGQAPTAVLPIANATASAIGQTATTTATAGVPNATGSATGQGASGIATASAPAATATASGQAAAEVLAVPNATAAAVGQVPVRFVLPLGAATGTGTGQDATIPGSAVSVPRATATATGQTATGQATASVPNAQATAAGQPASGQAVANAAAATVTAMGQPAIGQAVGSVPNAQAAASGQSATGSAVGMVPIATISASGRVAMLAPNVPNALAIASGAAPTFLLTIASATGAGIGQVAVIGQTGPSVNAPVIVFRAGRRLATVAAGRGPSMFRAGRTPPRFPAGEP